MHCHLRCPAICRLTPMFLAGALIVTGCKGDPTQQPHTNPTGGDYWRIKPAQMRVYPSTRFVVNEGQVVLEARIELFDEMGDSVKGVGHFHLELHTAGEKKASKRLYTWDVSARTLAEQRRYYESITRAYLFPLKLHSDKAPDREVSIEVIFTTPRGRRLVTQAKLGDTAARSSG